MSSSDDLSVSSCDSDDSEINYQMEDEDAGDDCSTSNQGQEELIDVEAYAYADEPLADEEWLAIYEAEKKEEEELESKLKGRLDGTEDVSKWCDCGNCDRQLLQNLSECYCCHELEGCVEALTSEQVVQDLAPGTKLVCIIEHPGFNAVCLQKWSLRLAADKYKTKGKKRYSQTGSEESFLRSISYREFSRLVYGLLGNKRIPLPSCAYVAIRKAFPCDKDEDFVGFELDEED